MHVIDVEGRDPARIADALCQHRACRLPDFVGTDVARALHAEALRLDSMDRFRTARMGRGAQATTATDLRGDRTLWLDAPEATQGQAFLATLDALGQALREALRMPIHGVEAHYAIYPPGGRYVRHRDRMRDDGARMVSWVTYLNPAWQPADGGQLRLYAEDGTFTDIAPRFGMSVCFLSDLEHEVLESQAPRLSIAGWMRRLD